MNRITFFILILLTTAASGDKKEPPDIPNNDTELTVLKIEYPKYFPNLMLPPSYEMTEEGVALGQKLYYDKMLSQGGPLDGKSCATCHIQESGFAKAGPCLPINCFIITALMQNSAVMVWGTIM
jgi:cytochrome c peroxidase